MRRVPACSGRGAAIGLREFWAGTGLAACCLVWAPSSYGQDSLPDPMRPADYVEPRTLVEAASQSASTAPPPPQELVLKGTYLATNGARWAIINGHKLRVGETIEGAMLLQVEDGRALLRREEESIDLKLIPGNGFEKK